MYKVLQSERTHIAFIGKRNVGKSSLVNRFVGQDLSIVSEIPGTTTDPVKKSMELLPFGPVVLIDTAGIDDIGILGEKRIQKTYKVISEADFAIFVVDSQNLLTTEENNLIDYIKNSELPFCVVINKSELGINFALIQELKKKNIPYQSVSCSENKGIYELKENIQKLLPNENEQSLAKDLVNRNDVIVLVVPIDLGAPKGRLILPQIQTLRDSLDGNAIVVVVQDTELSEALNKLAVKPKLVITDSQAIMRVKSVVLEDIPLTTFSILQARYKGELKEYVHGLIQVEQLNNGDKVLIAEACSHHAQEDDIGRVKIPRWLEQHSGKNLIIDFSKGHDYPENLNEYKLIIHCGGCMITRKAVQMRIKRARLAGVPIVNYGVLISYLHGAIPRAIKPFDEAISIWDEIQNEIKAEI